MNSFWVSAATVALAVILLAGCSGSNPSAPSGDGGSGNAGGSGKAPGSSGSSSTTSTTSAAGSGGSETGGTGGAGGQGSGRPAPGAGASGLGTGGKASTPSSTPDPDADGNAAWPEMPREYVVISTNLGEIVLELNRERAPVSVANFLRYTDEQFFDGVIFHRVIKGFMVQGGGFTPEGQKKPPKDGISNEWQNGLKNVRGSIAMARVGGRPDSGSSQWFINTVDNVNLDRPQADGAAYAVFGRVIAGMGVVDAIEGSPVRPGKMSRNEPVDMVIIESVRRLSPEDAHAKAG